MPLKQSVKLVLAMSIFCLSACSQYDIKVNEQLVYSPKKVLTDFKVADSNLQSCLDQTIKDQHITQASDLTQLICTDAGITQLAGLERFSQLQFLSLRSNNIESLDGLASLSEIRELNAADNDLRDASGILSLLNLERVDLSGNSQLECRELEQLLGFTQVEVLAPEHCVK